MTNLLIDNRDTFATVDTYSTFTGESADEMMRDGLREDGREDYDDVHINYDMPEIVKQLANESLGYTLEMVREYLNCKDITATIVETGSPKFYNYTTDWYVYAPILPDGVLAKYYADNMEACNTRLAGYRCNDQKENWQHATWCEIVDRAITKNNSALESDSFDTYKMHMWEMETEIYYNNMEVIESETK